MMYSSFAPFQCTVNTIVGSNNSTYLITVGYISSVTRQIREMDDATPNLPKRANPVINAPTLGRLLVTWSNNTQTSTNPEDVA